MPTRNPDMLSKSPIEILSELTTAIYVRVSSTGQLGRGYDEDGTVIRYPHRSKRANARRKLEECG
jgi:hypothetical protein